MYLYFLCIVYYSISIYILIICNIVKYFSNILELVFIFLKCINVCFIFSMYCLLFYFYLHFNLYNIVKYFSNIL